MCACRCVGGCSRGGSKVPLPVSGGEDTSDWTRAQNSTTTRTLQKETPRGEWAWSAGEVGVVLPPPIFKRFIDMDKVIGVQEVTASQQDKNHATFTVQCDGRTYQLQAHDEPSMRRSEYSQLALCDP